MKISTIIFDCDGTLLNTFEDLRNALNYALQAHGYPLHDDDYVRLRIGNGVSNLVKWNMPAQASTEAHAACLKTFEAYYENHMHDFTKPYPGIEDMLQTLINSGYNIAIVSNKYQEGVSRLNQDYFYNIFKVAIGTRPEVMRKPAPDMVMEAMSALGVTAEESIYVGDTEVDIETAKNANIPCIGVTWGFRDQATLEKLQASYLAHKALDIVSILKQINSHT